MNLNDILFIYLNHWGQNEGLNQQLNTSTVSEIKNGHLATKRYIALKIGSAVIKTFLKI